MNPAEFMRMVARLDHSGDAGFVHPDAVHEDARDALDRLIAIARANAPALVHPDVRMREALRLADFARSVVRERHGRAVAALAKLLDRYDGMVCRHEDTVRRGAVWTFCRNCSQRWDDYEGGFVPYADPPEVAEARMVVAVALAESLKDSPKPAQKGEGGVSRGSGAESRP